MKTVELNIKKYKVSANDAEATQIIYDGYSYDDARQEFIYYNEPLNEYGETAVLLEALNLTYIISIDDEDIEFIDNWDDVEEFIDLSNGEAYYPSEIAEADEYEILKEKIIDGSEVSANDLETQIYFELKSKLGWNGKNYNLINYNDNSVVIRLKDHSANPARMSKDTLSIVVANNNATSQWEVANSNNEIIIPGNTSLDVAMEMILNKLEEIIDRLS